MGWPARTALLPQVVPAEHFSNATTWSSSAFQVAATLGPTLGGLLLWRGPSLAYMADAACAISFLGFLAALRVEAAPRLTEPASLQSLVAGVRFVWARRSYWRPSRSICSPSCSAGQPRCSRLTRGILGVGEVGFGWLCAAPAIGAFAMALLQRIAPR